MLRFCVCLWRAAKIAGMGIYNSQLYFNDWDPVVREGALGPLDYNHSHLLER